MSGITPRQARMLRREIRKLYGRNFIPLLVANAPISIGDILVHPKDFNAVVDSSVFPKDLIQSSEGEKNNTNIVSANAVDLSVKAQGEGKLSEYFDVGEAGMAVTFSSDRQMFLKLQGTCIKTINNFPEFQNYILGKYNDGALNGDIYIVSSIIWADKYFLQFSGTNGGTVVFDLKVQPNQVDFQANADFNFKWSNRVGYSIDGSNGGVLGYQVSAVRLKDPASYDEVATRIRAGMRESDALVFLSDKSRSALVKEDKLEIRNVTSQLILEMEEDSSD